ncbi:HpcH/HpaI aldolase/citrate lyase family protein [Streptomyces solisilvae]|uniref:HpcH/HpaI aldolase/citrate lyase family protein n=1 Tax=Streptomyces malaysiensis TaxID=92644 RepID=UPI00369251C7
MKDLIRSWLYCPGTRPDIIRKALDSPADAVVVDLEDSVPATAKDAARANVVEALTWPRSKPLWVRMNALESHWGIADAQALLSSRPDGVRVPKCSDPEQVKRVADLVDSPLSLLIETAAGVQSAYHLAIADPRVVGISLGEADLQADLRTRHEVALDWARQRLVIAARAAALPSPSQSVYTAIRDDDGLRSTTLAGRDLGFFGRSIIHPAQASIVNEIFTPDPAEVTAARTVLEHMSSAAANGGAVAVDEAGRFIDPAVAEQAAWLVDVSNAIDARQTRTRKTDD